MDKAPDQTNGSQTIASKNYVAKNTCDKTEHTVPDAQTRPPQD